MGAGGRVPSGGGRMTDDKARTTRQQKAEATRRSIAEAALRLFSEQGVTGTSTRQIAELAGVSEGLIFHHFPDKTALLRAVAATRTTFGTEVVRVLDSSADRPVPEVLADVAKVFTKLVVAGTPEAQLFNVLLGGSRSNPELHQLFQAVVGAATDAFARYLGARVSEGEVRPDADLKAAGQSIVGGLILFFMTHSHLSASQWKRKAPGFAAEHMATIARGLIR